MSSTQTVKPSDQIWPVESLNKISKPEGNQKISSKIIFNETQCKLKPSRISSINLEAKDSFFSGLINKVTTFIKKIFSFLQINHYDSSTPEGLDFVINYLVNRNCSKEDSIKWIKNILETEDLSSPNEKTELFVSHFKSLAQNFYFSEKTKNSSDFFEDLNNSYGLIKNYLIESRNLNESEASDWTKRYCEDFVIWNSFGLSVLDSFGLSVLEGIALNKAADFIHENKEKMNVSAYFNDYSIAKAAYLIKHENFTVEIAMNQCQCLNSKIFEKRENLFEYTARLDNPTNEQIVEAVYFFRKKFSFQNCAFDKQYSSLVIASTIINMLRYSDFGSYRSRNQDEHIQRALESVENKRPFDLKNDLVTVEKLKSIYKSLRVFDKCL